MFSLLIGNSMNHSSLLGWNVYITVESTGTGNVTHGFVAIMVLVFDMSSSSAKFVDKMLQKGR